VADAPKPSFIPPPVAPAKPAVATPTIPPPAVPRRDTAVNPTTATPPASPPLVADRRGRYSELRLFVAALDEAIAAGSLAAVVDAVRTFKATSNALAAEVQRDKAELQRRRT
jgi:hypothetical protein